MSIKNLTFLFLILFMGTLKTESTQACPHETLSIKNEASASLVIAIGDQPSSTLTGWRTWHTDYCFDPGQKIKITELATGYEVYPGLHYAKDKINPPTKSFSLTCWGSLVSDLQCQKE
jgi:hypothetical protein